MRILLDECVNPRVRSAFPNHHVKTVLEMGWGGVTNGKLMALAQGSFEVFVTLDRNLEYQQNLIVLTFGIVVVSVPDNKIRSYRPLFPELLRVAEAILPGKVIHIPRVQNE